MKRFLLLGIGILAGIRPAQGQQISTLEQFLVEVRGNSFDIRSATSARNQAEADLAFFKSRLRPQVMLNANFPTYTRTSRSVVQPNGSLAFQPVFQNNAALTLSVEKPLLLTGGTLFLETGLERFDDFSALRSTFYNAIPVRLGYRQPLIGFNQWKWNAQIEDKRWQVAEKEYAFQVDNAHLNAVAAYFDGLIARTNMTLADSNRQANEKLLVIASERLDLGKISQDEKIQMEMQYKQAVLFQRLAENEYRQAKIRISGLLSGTVEISEELTTPAAFAITLPAEEVLLRMALETAPALAGSQLRLQIAQSQTAQAKAQWGPSLNLFATVGLAQSGASAAEVYQRPFNEQQLQAGISVPILDWGRRQTALQSGKEQITQAGIQEEQQRQVLINTVRQRYLDIQVLQARMQIQMEISAMAEERYRIGKERYIAGVMPVTDLILAQQNNDQAQRDYLLCLREFYLAYYDLRRLTGYDLRTGQSY